MFQIKGIKGTKYVCLAIGMIKHYFWLSAMFHSNAVSIKIYLKLRQSTNNQEFWLNRKDWIKTAFKVFACINAAALIIIACSISIHFVGGGAEASLTTNTNSNVYQLDTQDKVNCCSLTQPKFVLIFFAFPVAFVFLINLTLFLIVFFKVLDAFL